MTSIVFINEAHYFKSFNMFRTKSSENKTMFEMFQTNIPPLIRHRMVPECQQLNILSVGSAEGKTDMIILKIIKEELQRSDHGRQVRIFNRAIEPNEYSCGVYKAAIENLPSPLDDQQTAFEICQQTFEEYKESKKEPMKFDIVHFIHSIYYVDIEQTLLHCFEKELSNKGHFVCVVINASNRNHLTHLLLSRDERKQWQGAVASESFEIAKKLIQIANENGLKHEVYTQEYSIDVTEVFDPQSAEGNLLLDFLTRTVNFRDTADKQLLEETLALIKNLSVVKDGKLFGEGQNSMIVIYKPN